MIPARHPSGPMTWGRVTPENGTSPGNAAARPGQAGNAAGVSGTAAPSPSAPPRSREAAGAAAVARVLRRHCLLLPFGPGGAVVPDRLAAAVLAGVRHQRARRRHRCWPPTWAGWRWARRLPGRYAGRGHPPGAGVRLARGRDRPVGAGGAAVAGLRPGRSTRRCWAGNPRRRTRAAIGQPIFYLLVAFVVLAVPTGFMGATLPLLIRYAVRSDAGSGAEGGPALCHQHCRRSVRHGGRGLRAAAGAGAQPHRLGGRGRQRARVRHRGGRWRGSGSATALPARRTAPGARRAAAGPPGFADACIRPLFRGRGRAGPGEARGRVPRPARVDAAAHAGLSGANAFLYEVLWTRMLAHVIGGSIYAFATMLAAFFDRHRAGRRPGGPRWRSGASGPRWRSRSPRTAIGVLSIGVYAWMGLLIPDVRTTWTLAPVRRGGDAAGRPSSSAPRCRCRCACWRATKARATAGTARIYAWNTVGAIAGAVLAGFVLVPGLGFEGSIRFAVAVNFFLALWAAACVARPGAGPPWAWRAPAWRRCWRSTVRPGPRRWYPVPDSTSAIRPLRGNSITPSGAPPP